MSDDILKRIRDADIDQGADEIERLRLRVAELEKAIRRLADQDATLSACDGAVTVTMDATLTDAEREAVALFAAKAWSGLRWSEVEKHAAVLSGLLERTK